MRFSDGLKTVMRWLGWQRIPDLRSGGVLTMRYRHSGKLADFRIMHVSFDPMGASVALESEEDVRRRYTIPNNKSEED